MRPLTLSDLAAVAVGQTLALVVVCSSTYAVWIWLTEAHPFK